MCEPAPPDEPQSTVSEPSTERETLSDSEFLLSIAGMFSSGATDTSENTEEYVAEAIKKKYS
jgi:hypothetical protein